ncbi:pyridoxal phosphate-dependent transferase [Aspergillus cavernicola]|uniref:Ornithine aminotransferase n=1 Tax=Aspergillus cavernicola TaxID=176166 RepID=A0ABR4I742_9EURO
MILRPQNEDDAPEQYSTKDYLHYDTLYSVEGMPSHDVVMTRGQGAFLWDLEGKRYIDFNAGFSSCNQGHCHPAIVEAMRQQCGQLAMPSRSVHVSQYAMFCKRICEVTGFDKVAMLNGGAEAVDMAIKFARAWGYTAKGIQPDEALVLTAESNYHGRALSLLSGSTDEHYRKNCGPWMPNIGPHCAGNTIRFGHIEDLEEAFNKSGSRIAAFVIECVQGHAGCLAATDEYLVAVRQLCTKHNVLFIADEIQAGLGRTGHLFSYMSADVKPDLVVLGKSLSGGLYPISAVIGTKEAMGGIEPGQYGSTFSGNPLASAVALAALNVILDENLTERAAMLGEIFETRLRAIKSPYFDTVTGKGLFRSIYIHESHPQGRVTGKRLVKLCLKRGLVANAAGRRLRICPSLVIEQDTMLEGVRILEQALSDLPDLEEV